MAYVARSGYTPRAMVAEGLNLAASPKAAIADYYEANGKFPIDDTEAGLFGPIEGRYASDVSIEPGGIIEISYGGARADRAIAGKVLVLRAIIDEDSGEISWSCSPGHLAKRHLPAMCR